MFQNVQNAPFFNGLLCFQICCFSYSSRFTEVLIIEKNATWMEFMNAWENSFFNRKIYSSAQDAEEGKGMSREYPIYFNGDKVE